MLYDNQSIVISSADPNKTITVGELVERLHVVRRVAQRGLAYAQLDIGDACQADNTYVDLFQHMLDELELIGVVDDKV